MAYVDLNPVRAGISSTPEQSGYTSINDRVTHHGLNDVLCPLNRSESQLNLSLPNYLVLIDEEGRCIWDNKSGYVPDKAEPILTRRGLNAAGYIDAMSHLSGWFYRMIAPPGYYEEIAEKFRRKWLKGRHRARQLFNT